MLLALDLIVVIAALFYTGGLGSLGAIVAPAVFRSGWDGAGSVMTKIFLRFDRVAMVLVFAILACELLRIVLTAESLRGRWTLKAWARPLVSALFALSVGVQSGYLSPQIAQMYEQGISPRHPQFGQHFTSVHKTSSAVGKASVLVAIVLAGLVLSGRANSELTAKKKPQTDIDGSATTA